MNPVKKLQFSGHDSFECRHFWLKKGYDNIIQGNKFGEEAVVSLGVGRNMVTAIRFWMRAYGLINELDHLTDFAHLIFGENGLDPYLEDEATLWLLHFQLITQNYSSIYSIIFNEFRKQRPDFTKEHLQSFIRTKHKTEVNEVTFSKDFEVFTKTYIPRNDDTEENYDGLLTELHLVSEIKKAKTRAFVIESAERIEIPAAVILFCMLQKSLDKSINFENAFTDINSVGVVFAMTRQGLATKFEEIAKEFELVFSDNAGIKELHFKKTCPNPFDILKKYYEIYAD